MVNTTKYFMQKQKTWIKNTVFMVNTNISWLKIHS